MAAKLEEITKGTRIRGIIPNEAVTVVDVNRHADDICEVIYKDTAGRTGTELVYRDQEADLEILEAGTLLSFTADGERFRLVFEALRIRLAHLFDPMLAVHSSQIIPLPHQITAVYEEMLPRQPLRFLLADDPGSGKTIQAGLLIKELMARGDLRRCLIVAPGSLVEQWQDELSRKFDLAFDIMTNDAARAAHSGNWFTEHPLCIARLDKLSRDEDMQAKLKAVDWDLVVCDESHKLAATVVGSEIKYTKRYRLGQLLSENARHFLLMTATPHNGKEADFQLFLALLDGDRFEGRYRDGVHTEDASDLMRRLVKEKLVRFDGTPLFPERIAYTVPYALSEAEAKLYVAVSSYVSDEFNRADQIANGTSKGNVGFALTSLQRRLASSPEAIYQSLRRRRERLEKRLREEQLRQRGEMAKIDLAAVSGIALDEEDANDPLDDATDNEREETEEKLLDEASAAQTIVELSVEIGTLTRLEALAQTVRLSGTDRKWDELSKLLQTNREMFDTGGMRRKLVIFTEHRDTLNYLMERISNLLGRADSVVSIHGGMGREERRNAQEAFSSHPDVRVLIATDAAGEGINLHRGAHLMVNYDLPWNPNRLEQRFGRIHRIGQTEVCHLWNLVASETREGDVYKRLLEKLEEERKALGGQVFDVLGQMMFGDQPLWKLLIEAVRYGDSPEVRAKLFAKVEGALDRKHLQELLEQRALVEDAMDLSSVRKIREEMERAEARRLQPHFVEGFFLAAFEHLGGSIKPREGKRYEVTWVPASIRRRDRVVGQGEAVLSKYERVTFERDAVTVQGKPHAALVCPGHPLLDATVSLVIEQYREMLKRGAVLVDENDDGEDPRLMWALEHDIRDARLDKAGARRVISKRLVFVEQRPDGSCRAAGYAPYLDYRPLADGEQSLIAPLLADPWLRGDLEASAVSYAIGSVVPEHYDEVRKRREAHITKTRAAVHARLTTEIGYWDHRAEELRLKEEAGAQPKINSQMAARRRDELIARLARRMEELDQERRISRASPIVMGGALVVPIGYLKKMATQVALAGESQAIPPPPRDFGAKETREVERLAMEAVIAAEQALGYEPRDVSAAKIGYDIESKVPNEGRLRFIEVKGRVVGAETVTVTKNEVLTALNKPDDYILAIVEVENGAAKAPRYLRRVFTREPGFAESSVNLKLAELLAVSEEPS